MEPLSLVTGAISIGKQLFELGKKITDREIKHQLDEIGDKVRELKQSASALEDENRELREKLRFKSEDYEFRHPFWYDKANRDRALCPMGLQGEDIGDDYRKCLVCGEGVEVSKTRHKRNILTIRSPIHSGHGPSCTKEQFLPMHLLICCPGNLK